MASGISWHQREYLYPASDTVNTLTIQPLKTALRATAPHRAIDGALLNFQLGQN